MTFGAIAYGTASAAFLLLTVLLVTRWKGRAHGVRLILASAITAAWAAVQAYGALVTVDRNSLAVFADFVRDVAWLLVLTGLMERQAPWVTLARLSGLVALTAITLAVARLFVEPAWLSGSAALGVMEIGKLALSLVGVVLLEQLYRNANSDGRRALKSLVLGVGILFAYDLFLYSEAHLLSRVEPGSWAARGLVSAAVVPLLALAAHRNPGWSLSAFVSRHVVFHMTSFLVIAAYILILAAGGHLTAFTGETWGRIVHLTLFAGAGIALLSVASSARLRRRLRVFLSKYVYRYKYDYRIEWLRFIDTLSHPDTQADVRGNAVRSIAQIIDSPGGVLYLSSGPDTAYAPVAGWPGRDGVRSGMPEVGVDEDLPRFLRRLQWVVDLKEYARSPELYDNMALPRFPYQETGFRVIVPLVLGEQLLGFVLLVEPLPSFETTYEDRDLLKTVGRDVAMHLAQHEADRQLAESRQFEAYHRLTAFVMHDLKNLAAQLSMVVSNAERHRRNPEFVDDAISTIAHSAARMQRLMEQLKGRELQVTLRRTSLNEVARVACARCSARYPAPTLSVGDGDAHLQADPERLGMMIEHLIRNAQDATPGIGEVRVSVHVDRAAEIDTGGSAASGTTSAPSAGTSFGQMDIAVLCVSDSGAGMTQEFVKERLFRPFDSTKGTGGMGIGAYQVREYVQALGGRVLVTSTPGAGTTVMLRLPACP